MSEINSNFHTIALQTSLFKGQDNLYVCLLKAEKIAHVLAILTEYANYEDEVQKVFQKAILIPDKLIHMVSGSVLLSEVVADIFSILFSLRLLVTTRRISKETALIIITEYEKLLQKIDSNNRVSPFVTSEDFLIQPFVQSAHPKQRIVANELEARSIETETILKDNFKGQRKVDDTSSSTRTEKILQFVQQNKGVSIRDITSIIRNYSEKTVQRELVVLVQKGLIRKVGERRWSTYEPI